MSELATIAKNLILFSQIASGTISFATGATAATIVSADITKPEFPVSTYLYALQNNASQTTIAVQINNVRTIASASTPFELASISLTTGQAKDVLAEGSFAGNASLRMRFSINSAATAAEIISANYQIWAVR